MKSIHPYLVALTSLTAISNSSAEAARMQLNCSNENSQYRLQYYQPFMKKPIAVFNEALTHRGQYSTQKRNPTLTSNLLIVLYEEGQIKGRLLSDLPESQLQENQSFNASLVIELPSHRGQLQTIKMVCEGTFTTENNEPCGWGPGNCG